MGSPTLNRGFSMGSRRVPRGVLGCFGASGLRDFGDATWRGTRSKLLNPKRVSPSLEASTATYV